MVSPLKDKGGEGAKELEECHSDRMKVLQLDVCSEEQVNQAAEFIKDNLADSERGKLYSVVQQDPELGTCVHSLTFCLYVTQVCGL